ncbi:MAG: tRNA (adenosine(37)-N6)-threonylcarbamoyltransferase complex transferase subunit TsaD [Chitinispirillales bacterium]|jgi:N6-L-threonylcarbamoyladenine synthase|nr:tRNA (adenosine(37)-N6)-threonylcarbamoyltransferase complex transferase subunit TsaD [Chitinispirillales bacterium]
MVTLGIESSCDETSVALLRDGVVLSSLTHSQGEHALYGGVVPEVASRAHLEKIDGLARRVMEEAGIVPSGIDLIAVTDSPGLAGALLVGVSFALGMHAAHGIPVTGVNHLEGHICSLFIDNGGRQSAGPLLVLLASGGHTAVYKYASFGDCELLGCTVDDAAGEAFDKVGKLLGFPYPAGRAIEEEAAKAESSKRPEITFPVARFSSPGKPCCFSFSGLKTAVKNFILSKGEDYINNNRPALCSAFQKAVVDSLAGNMEAAARSLGIKTAAAAGGVACNGFLREELARRFGEGNVFFPRPSLCTDNGAMIAMAGQMMRQNSRLRFPSMDPGRGI